MYCECLRWARVDGRATDHHPRCPEFKEETFEAFAAGQIRVFDRLIDLIIQPRIEIASLKVLRTRIGVVIHPLELGDVRRFWA